MASAIASLKKKTKQTLECSPIYEQSLVGVLIGGTIIPTKDFEHKGEHPKVNTHINRVVEVYRPPQCSPRTSLPGSTG